MAYVDAAGRRVRLALIHQAVLGSIERFIGILLEDHRGERGRERAGERACEGGWGTDVTAITSALADRC